MGGENLPDSKLGGVAQGVVSRAISRGFAESRGKNLPKSQELRNWGKTSQISHGSRDQARDWTKNTGRVCRLKAHRRQLMRAQENSDAISRL